jgi:hypothetical protein
MRPIYSPVFDENLRAEQHWLTGCRPLNFSLLFLGSGFERHGQTTQTWRYLREWYGAVLARLPAVYRLVAWHPSATMLAWNASAGPAQSRSRLRYSAGYTRLHGSTGDLPLVRCCNLARGVILTLPDARKPGEGILPQYGCRCPGCCLADNIRSVHISSQTTMQRLPPQAPPWVRGRMWLPATEGY